MSTGKGERRLEWDGRFQGVALVEHDADEACCGSCIDDQFEGYVDTYSDHCCCVHGELFGYRWAGAPEVRWVTPESRERWAALPDPRGGAR